MTTSLHQPVAKLMWMPGEDQYLQAEAPSLVVGVGKPVELKAAEHEPKLTRLAGIQGCCIWVHSGAFHRNELPPWKIYSCLLACTRCKTLQVTAC